MGTGIREPSLTSVETLLAGNTLFTVPIHQRSFDWTTDEAEELWEDICLAMTRGDEDYFLGTIVLRQVDASADKGAHHTRQIIDGQQRLACISMVFSAIRNAFASRNDTRADDIFRDFLGSKGYETDATPKPKLTLNEINDEVYRVYVVESQNQASVTKALRNPRMHPSNRKLLQAYAYFLGKVNAEVALRGTDYDEYLVPLINCLKGRVKLIVIPVADEESAYLVFESVNARGKELAVSDLVKNRLYYEVGPGNVGRAKKLWDLMEVDLGAHPIPEYLRHYWIAKKADSGSRKVREKALYREILRSLPSKSREAEAMGLLSDLSRSARDYAMISDYSLWPDAPDYGEVFKGYLGDLELFRVSQCYPVLLNVIQRFKSPREIADAFRAVANFSFRYNIIGSGTSGSLESIFGGIAYDVRVGECTSAQDIADQLRSVCSDAKFRTDFQLATFSRRKSKMARYSLAKLENYLRLRKRPTSIDTIDPDNRRISLEHILPQNEDSHAKWRAHFGANLDPGDYVYRIGNLTLTTQKINRESADKSFQHKKAAALQQSDLLIDEKVKKASQWGNAEIDQRQTTLAKHAVQVWKL